MIQEKKHFVAYLDVLGFGNFNEKNPQSEVIKWINFFSLQAQIAIAYTSVARVNEGIQDEHKAKPYKLHVKEDGVQVAVPDLDRAKINSLIMFDSIVFWTPDDKEEDLKDLLYAVALFMRTQLSIGFPARGAIAHGEFSFSGGPVHSSSIVQHFILASKAQALARKLEGQQEWVGCALHETVIDRCVELSLSLQELENSKRIIKYSVPFKKQIEPNGYREMYALIFAGQTEQFIPERKILDIYTVIKESFEQHGKEAGPREIEKINNTAKFINDVFPVVKEKEGQHID
ncbi:MAG: hypothetical protein ABI597_04525 [Gammaproteobacteria bacterium]